MYAGRGMPSLIALFVTPPPPLPPPPPLVFKVMQFGHNEVPLGVLFNIIIYNILFDVMTYFVDLMSKQYSLGEGK